MKNKTPTHLPVAKKKASKTRATVSHDPVFPNNLCDFMLTKWSAPKRKLPAKVPGYSYFEQRRRTLGSAFTGDLLIVPTGHEKVRANDTCYPFRPGSDFYYLTGNLEPDCALVFVPQKSGVHKAFLFVEPNPGRSDITFFTDREKGELWVGPRLGIAQSAHRYGLPNCRPIRELASFVQEHSLHHPWRMVRGIDPALDALLVADDEQKKRDRTFMAALSEMRLLKDAHELRALIRACDSTRRGFEDVIQRLAFARSEREVEGVFNLRARMEGNAVGYNTIAASGQHACVLHWSQNYGELGRKDLLLLDAGVEGHELYTADITRTLPIGGKFSKHQRKIYDLVLKAHSAAMAKVCVGEDFMAPNTAAMAVLTHGLVELGVLADAQEALRTENQFYRRYTLHNVSHMLGIDVHDCAQARQQSYKYGKLEAGMVLTVEPGLYFQADDLTVPKELRGIGVRIEDDIVVTKRGYKILSDMPRTADDVERWMKDVWRRTKARA